LGLFEKSKFYNFNKKSKARGYFLSLSGGADSGAVSLLIYNMCNMLFEEIQSQKQNN
jgi:hypothetical protein